MAVDRTRAQQRLAALSRTEFLLRGLLDDTEIRTLRYEPDTRALLIEYSGGTSDLVEQFHERLLTVGLACAHGLQSQRWPADFDRVIGVACDPAEAGFEDAYALRWNAPIDWLKQLTAEDVSDSALGFSVLEGIEVLYPDGRVETVDLTETVEE